MDDRTQMRLAACEVVSAGLQKSGEDRLPAAVAAIPDVVPPHQIEEFWVALIEYSVSTMSTFLAVCGDEITNPRGRRGVILAGHRQTCPFDW